MSCILGAFSATGNSDTGINNATMDGARQAQERTDAAAARPDAAIVRLTLISLTGTCAALCTDLIEPDNAVAAMLPWNAIIQIRICSAWLQQPGHADMNMSMGMSRRFLRAQRRNAVNAEEQSYVTFRVSAAACQ